MLMKKVRSIGRGAWFGALAGVAGGLALAVPGGPVPGGVVHAIMAGASTGAPPPAHGGDGPTTTVPKPEPTTTAPTTAAPRTEPTAPPTTAAPGGTSTTSVPSPSGSAGTAPGDQPPTTCAGQITSFEVTVGDGGQVLLLKVTVTGHVGWMSAYAAGFGGAALTPVPGGFEGTITGKGPVSPGTEVVVGSCGNRVRASTKVGGGPSGAATPPTGDATTTTTAPHNDLPPGCATATITSMTARLRGGGAAVTVNVTVDGSVGWMSGEVEGFGGVTLHAVPGGFEGTLTVDGTIPAGTVVVVGTCGGKLRATAIVVAA